ncbi:ribosomal L7Ae/L30e/S12e/Gadd45 family protein [Liquorilactobacillus mali]|uniref:50S ribosomal protein L7AE n=1 Tax=Liquorilactobacillus mali TaxID=1618 RepID=A0A0R2FQQ2_9LACO|nr:ribosomal L7Ae/L30e/S12e/Gadd45 family protein [Liquorilactobacillus mali]KRN30430.1 50S ribosomal protein L7AE [Liquorilactobacillus mali]MDN7144624.1 ribosomal L7Ae/L30e/S12e/Gadd45 family protein [Liquorilactobacillus mali]
MLDKRQRALQMLGLARRAGKLITGEEGVLKKVRAQKVQIVFVASDGSEGTKKKFIDKCKSYQININCDFTHQELSLAIGANRTVLAIDDLGFSKKIMMLLS